MQYLDDLGTISIKENLLPWQRQGLSYTASGYGAKIPSRFMARIAGEKRWYRVYVAQYGNAGSPYVIRSGKKYFLKYSEY